MTVLSEDARGFRCFCAEDFKLQQGSPHGSLAGLTFAAKDLIDTAGSVTGGGNPDWRRTHGPADKNAPCVQALLDAGATLAGKTITDELAFSLEGENHFDGTPVNPTAPDRLPGGSSSGSAVAVAGGLVDFALGTDTGGSIRVPAAFCGIYGIRPTHGVISTEGVLPFAPSLDSVGWFARDAATLAKVGAVLLPDTPAQPISQILIAEDGFALCEPDVASILMEATSKLGLKTRPIKIAPFPLLAAADCYRHVQAADIVQVHGQWLRETRPHFGPSIAPRFESIWDSSPQDIEEANWRREELRAHVRGLFRADESAAIALPCAPSFALQKGLPASVIGDFYARALSIGAIASLCALPQVAIPIKAKTGLFAGLGLIAMSGADRALVDLASRSR